MPEIIRDAWEVIFHYFLAIFRKNQIKNLELVSVTDTSVVITWITSEDMESSISYGKTKRMEQSEYTPAPTRYHYVEIDGLDPNTCYYCRVVGKHTSERKRFQTFDRPGDHLFDFATLADLHLGEAEDNSAKLAQAAINDINQRSMAFTIVKGDITGNGKSQQMDLAKNILSELTNGYYPVLGNHDVCQEESGDFGEQLFVRTFADKLPDGLTYYSFDYSNYHFVCLDSVSRNPAPFDNPGVEPNGEISDPQLEWLEQDLENTKEMPTLVFLHHPVTKESDINSVWPFQMAVQAGRGRSRFQKMIRNYNVIGVLSGHTHRNEVTHSEKTRDLPYVETAATKEYPCGYNIYRVFTQGYIQTFYKNADHESLRLSEESRDSIRVSVLGGLLKRIQSSYKFGDEISERNYVFKWGG